MTTLHAPSRHWLLWCDYCGVMFSPHRDRKAQSAAADAAGWYAGQQGDMCPVCRPVVRMEMVNA